MPSRIQYTSPARNCPEQLRRPRGLSVIHGGDDAPRALHDRPSPAPGAPMFPAGSPLAKVWREAGAGWVERWEKAARKDRRSLPGGFDFQTINAMALDPLEWWRYPQLLGVTRRLTVYEPGEIEWWPREPERVALLLTPAGLLALGLYTGRSFDLATEGWARDPIERLVFALGIRPGAAAWRIARAFGLSEVPRVR